MDHHPVIHVANIPLYLELLDKLVEFVEIDIGEKLAGKIADWNPGIPRTDDVPAQIHGARTTDFTGKNLDQRGMVNGGEIAPDIRFQAINTAVRAFDLTKPSLHPIRSGMRPFSRAASVGVIIESFFPDRLDGGDERMLQHPVPEWQGGGHPFLGLINLEDAIRAGTIHVPHQFVLKLDQLALKVGFET